MLQLIWILMVSPQLGTILIVQVHKTAPARQWNLCEKKKRLKKPQQQQQLKSNTLMTPSITACSKEQTVSGILAAETTAKYDLYQDYLTCTHSLQGPRLRLHVLSHTVDLCCLPSPPHPTPKWV